MSRHDFREATPLVEDHRSQIASEYPVALVVVDGNNTDSYGILVPTQYGFRYGSPHCTDEL
mgnify:CR=1 FL=1